MISAPDTVNLSNMPASADVVVGTEARALDAFAPEVVDILGIRNSQKFRITTFQTTPLMSTYIVAYANGPFKFLESSVSMPLSGKTIPLRVYGTYLTAVSILGIYSLFSDLRSHSSSTICARRHGGLFTGV